MYNENNEYVLIQILPKDIVTKISLYNKPNYINNKKSFYLCIKEYDSENEKKNKRLIYMLIIYILFIILLIIL